MTSTLTPPPPAPAPRPEGQRRPLPALSDLGPARLIPALAATGAVVAAGIAFGRVFGFGNVAVPLVVATIIGIIGGLASRVVLAAGAARLGRAERAAATQGSEATPEAEGDGDIAPAFLTADANQNRATGLVSRGADRVAALAICVVTTLLAGIIVDAAAAKPGPGGSAIGKGITALAGGWSRILTTSVPVPPTADRLPVFGGVVALAVAVAVIAASRPHPGIDALVPAGATLLVALGLGVHGPGSVVAVSAAPAVLGGVYLLTVSRPADVGVAWIPAARGAAAVATGAVVVIIALLVGSNWPLATARAPVNLRNRLNPPLNLGSVPNPLDLVPQLLSEPGTTVFTAHVDQTWLNSPTDWKLVSLDQYNGAGWASDARAVRAGTALPLPPGQTADHIGPASTQTVRVNALDGPWVPVTGVPTGVGTGDLAFDPTASILVGSPDINGKTFTLHSRIPAPSAEALDSSGITVSKANATLTQVPSCVPQGLTQLASRAVAGLTRPDQEAAAIEQILARGGGFAANPTASPGSSCGRLQQFLSAKQGAAEQFATAFVLMARSVGLPSRLAVGFTAGEVNRAAGTTAVHGSDATVWPQVDFAGVGWVSFDPVPTATSPNHGGAGSQPSTTINQSNSGLQKVLNTVGNASATTNPNGTHSNGAGHRTTSSGSGWSWYFLIPILVVAAIAGFLAFRILGRRRRRARRRDRTRPPQDRNNGAWAEVLDALAPFDPDVAALTPSEVATTTGRAVAEAAAPVASLGVLVDASVYAGLGGPEEADTAWNMSDQATTALRHAVPAGRRIRNLITGRPRRGQVSRPGS